MKPDYKDDVYEVSYEQILKALGIEESPHLVSFEILEYNRVLIKTRKVNHEGD